MVCWAAVAPVVIWAGVRLTGWERGPAVQLLAFTPYVAGLSLVPVVLALALRRWVVAAVAVLTTLALVAVVAPRAVADDTPAGGPVLRVMTVNMLGGQAQPGDIVRLVRDLRVDVLSVQELYPGVVEGLSIAGIDRELPYHQVYGAEAGMFSRLPVGGHRGAPQPGRLPPGVRDGAGARRAAGAVRGGALLLAVLAAADELLAPRTCPRSHRPPRTGRCASWPATSTRRSTTRRCGGCWARGYVDAADARGRGAGGHLGPVRRRPHPAGDDRPRAGGPPDRRTRRCPCTRSRAATTGPCWPSCRCRAGVRRSGRCRRAWARP